MSNMATTSQGASAFKAGANLGQGTQNKQQGDYHQSSGVKARNQPAYKAAIYKEYGASAPKIKKGSTGETDS